MKVEEIFKGYQDFVLPTYSRQPAIFTKGKGSYVWDVHGRRYLDFFPGWGVSILGHCPPKVVSAVKEQVKKLIHIPNNYYHHLQAKLAREIVRYSFKGKVFFCNSGAESNEAAIKLARAYGAGRRYEIIAMENSFHGRTLAALSATAQEKYRQGFGPLLDGFRHVPFNDIGAIRKAVTERTVAVILEPIQGEGGVNVAKEDYLTCLRELCNQRNVLLIFDEVQTGMGRTGKMFCFQHYGLEPDVLTLAKALGGGLPIGAMVVRDKFAHVLRPGMHASTFGGSPLVCKAALAVLETIGKEKLLTNAAKKGEYLCNKLRQLKEKFSVIKEIRGKGLMVGIELDKGGDSIVEECLKKGLLINCTQERILRLMPAITVTKGEVDKAVAILDGTFAHFR